MYSLSSLFKKGLQVLAFGTILGLPVSAGTILNTYPDWAGNITNVFIKDAQTFLAPSDNVLSSFQFKMFNSAGQSVQLQIFAWDANGPTGAALYTSPTFIRINAIQDFLVSNINLTLVQGALYGAVVDNFGYNGQNAAFNLNQNSYTGGNLWLVSGDTPNTWNNYASSGYNLTFQANFVNAAAPVGAVPEPGAMLLLSGGLVALTVFSKYVGPMNARRAKG